MKQVPTDVTKERLYEEFSTVVSETEQLLKSFASAGGDKAGAIKASVEEGLAAASDRMAKLREQSIAQANAAARATEEYVQGNPWNAIGIAAAVGVTAGIVAGVLIARR